MTLTLTQPQIDMLIDALSFVAHNPGNESYQDLAYKIYMQNIIERSKQEQNQQEKTE